MRRCEKGTCWAYERGKATKIMAVADRHGLPIACGLASGQRREEKLVHETLKARFVDDLPERLIGDKAYDSNQLDADLAAMGIDMIAPNHTTRTAQTQDRRKLPRYKRRWLIERLFAWLMRSRRLVTRYQLACAAILLRRL